MECCGAALGQRAESGSDHSWQGYDEGVLPGQPGEQSIDRGIIMGLGDKIKHAAEKAGGKGKEAAGKATGDERLKAEGQTDQAKANLKQAAEKVKDVFKKH